MGGVARSNDSLDSVAGVRPVAPVPSDVMSSRSQRPNMLLHPQRSLVDPQFSAVPKCVTASIMVLQRFVDLSFRVLLGGHLDSSVWLQGT
jgi:hypothetical protein